MTQWWIDKGRLMGSSNPTTDEIRELHSRGFRTIISLIEQGMERPKYDVEVAKAIGFKLHVIPIPNFGAPTMKQFEEFLSILRRTPSSGMILVHCGGGQGRTGTMGAAYWIGKGLSADEAIWEIRKSNPGAIETLDQERSLRELEANLRSRNAM